VNYSQISKFPLKELHIFWDTKSFSGMPAENTGLNKMKLDLAPKPVPLENSYNIILEILKRA